MHVAAVGSCVCLSLEIPFLPREFLHILPSLPLTTLILSVRRNRRGWFLPPLISIPERESNSKLGLCPARHYLGTHAHAANYLENQFGTTNEDKERILREGDTIGKSRPRICCCRFHTKKMTDYRLKGWHRLR